MTLKRNPPLHDQDAPHAGRSRRDLLAWTLVAPLAAGLATQARAQVKMSKKLAHYQDHPNGNKQCSNCQFFQASENKCTIVQGDISPNGYCIHFEKKR